MAVARSINILHVDPDVTERRIAQALLRRALTAWRGDGVVIDVDVVSEPTVESALRALTERSFDVALVDLDLPDARGLEILRAFRVVAPHVPVIVLSRTLNAVDAVSSMSFGIHDWISKSHMDPERLVMSVLRAVTAPSPLAAPVPGPAVGPGPRPLAGPPDLAVPAAE